MLCNGDSMNSEGNTQETKLYECANVEMQEKNYPFIYSLFCTPIRSKEQTLQPNELVQMIHIKRSDEL